MQDEVINLIKTNQIKHLYYSFLLGDIWVSYSPALRTSHDGEKKRIHISRLKSERGINKISVSTFRPHL